MLAWFNNLFNSPTLVTSSLLKISKISKISDIYRKYRDIFDIFDILIFSKISRYLRTLIDLELLLIFIAPAKCQQTRYLSEFTEASRGFPATAWLSCFDFSKFVCVTWCAGDGGVSCHFFLTIHSFSSSFYYFSVLLLLINTLIRFDL